VLAVLALAPLILAAADPPRDIAPCRASSPGPGDPPDLVEATGTIVEQGTSARWELRFSSPLVVPDRAGRPFRVDVLIRDPSVPTVDVAYYRDLNRIVRYDAIAEQGLVILLLPERAQNVFLGGVVEGERLTLQVPGRQITRDLDLEGVPIEDLRWTVVIRDEHRCDVLGSARPHLAMVAPRAGEPTGSPSVAVSPTPSDPDPGRGSSWAAIAVVGPLSALALALVIAVYVLLRRRPRDRSR
jgi:hypothetical protein